MIQNSSSRKDDPMEKKISDLYQDWMEKAQLDPDLISELTTIKGQEKEVEDRFYCNLTFGTAGLRGVIGAGTNRMNIYTVGQATQGLAEYLLSKNHQAKIAIAYDSRHKSLQFAQETARVMAANGVQVYIYQELMPTPALSYAVRELGCDGGVNITASHNPAQYNGYKAYDETGCQIGEEIADTVMTNITQTDIFTGVKRVDFDQALADGKIKYIEEDLIQKYINRVLEEQVNPGVCQDTDLKLVYTPLNGAGKRCVTTVLDKIGIKDITIVPEQSEPDGDFPTCPYPNPEILEALELGLKLTQDLKADLLLATDPDCDRVGAAVMTQKGQPRLISGNEMGVLLLDYIARSKKSQGKLSHNPVVVKSIVTTTMAEAVAKEYNVEVWNVLTGFKYIGEKLLELEKAGQEDRFLLGFEESYGYLSAGYVRDKDAVDGSMLICEMAAWYKKTQGKNLGEALDELYQRFGYFINKVDSFTFAGSDGMAKIAEILNKLRKDPPTEIGGQKVISRSDYQTSIKITDGQNEEKITLPKSNVLGYSLGGLDSVVVRPSGTEPKLKIYYSVKADNLAEAQKELANYQQAINQRLELKK